MLLFATMLDINDKMGKEDFIRLVIEWNQSSAYAENVIPNLVWNGEYSIRFGNDKLWLEIMEYEKEDIVAVRYEKVGRDGVIWDTDFIMNFGEGKLSILLDRSYLENARMSGGDFYSPKFISMLMEKGYLADDDNLPVGETPVYIDGENANMLADIIEERRHYHLPVVYVSKLASNQDPLSVQKLAVRLRGMAHVLVQKDIADQETIRNVCNSRNEFDGAIGVFYPNESMGHRICIYREEKAETERLAQIANFIFRYGSMQQIPYLYTWSGVNDALLRELFHGRRQAQLDAEEAQRRAESEVQDVYTIMGEELSTLQHRIDDLTRSNESLSAEVYGLRARLAKAGDIPVLVQGEEESLYEGEIRDFVLEILEEARTRALQNSRKAHILNDLLKKNPYEHLGEKRRQEVKRCMKNYKGVTSVTRQQLQDLGFRVIDEEGHYKLVYCGDSRYMVTLSNSPSDFREGENNASDIIKQMM